MMGKKMLENIWPTAKKETRKPKNASDSAPTYNVVFIWASITVDYLPSVTGRG